MLLEVLPAKRAVPHTHDRQVPVVHLQHLLVAIFTCRVNNRISSVKAAKSAYNTNKTRLILTNCTHQYVAMGLGLLTSEKIESRRESRRAALDRIHLLFFTL